MRQCLQTTFIYSEKKKKGFTFHVDWMQQLPPLDAALRAKTGPIHLARIRPTHPTSWRRQQDGDTMHTSRNHGTEEAEAEAAAIRDTVGDGAAAAAAMCIPASSGTYVAVAVAVAVAGGDESGEDANGVMSLRLKISYSVRVVGGCTGAGLEQPEMRYAWKIWVEGCVCDLHYRSAKEVGVVVVTLAA